MYLTTLTHIYHEHLNYNRHFLFNTLEEANEKVKQLRDEVYNKSYAEDYYKPLIHRCKTGHYWNFDDGYGNFEYNCEVSEINVESFSHSPENS